jgi:hypothetical protein
VSETGISAPVVVGEEGVVRVGIVNLVGAGCGWDDRLVARGGAGVGGGRAPSYVGFRFPVEIISHCVWLYHRFPLSFREVEEMMLERGIVVSHETVRQWCTKFGQTYANGLRRRRPPPRRQVAAPRRGVHQDRREDSLLVAGGRPGGQRARHSGHLPTRHQGRHQVLSQTAHGTGSTYPGFWSPTSWPATGWPTDG